MPKSKVKEQWAAILWENNEKNKKARLCDVVDLICIPKKYRTEGCIASLKWVDTSTGKTSYHKAEVVKISNDKEALEQLCINSNTGKITDPSEKIFSSEVLDKKKEQQQEQKKRKTAQNKASVQIAAKIAKDTSIFDDKNINDMHSQSSETVSSLTLQETHPPMTSSTLCASLSTATVNYSNNSSTLTPLSPRESRSPQHPELLSACPSAASEFGYKLAPTALSTQALLPSSCISFTDSNYMTKDPRHSQLMTTCSPSVTENPQWFPTITTSLLPLPTQQYLDKSTAQEVRQPIHGSASQTSQSNEPLQSCSQLPNFSQSKCILKNDSKNNSKRSKDKLERFMDAFMTLGPEVTESNIRFFEAVITAIKSTYKFDNSEASKESYFKISDFYTSPGKGKVEIFPGTNFYFYEGIKENIMEKSKILDQKTSQCVNHWPLLVRHALIEVYGKDLALFSAKGSKKDGRPGINAQFYKALYYWACDWNGTKIDEEKYIDSINKAAYNKRKAHNQAKRILKNKDAEETVISSQEQTIKVKNQISIPSTTQSQDFPRVYQMTDVQMPSCSYTDTGDHIRTQMIQINHSEPSLIRWQNSTQ